MSAAAKLISMKNKMAAQDFVGAIAVKERTFQAS